MPKVLRQKTTGRIFPFIEAMSARADMEVVDTEDKKEAIAKKAKVAKKESVPADTTVVADTVVAETVPAAPVADLAGLEFNEE